MDNGSPRWVNVSAPGPIPLDITSPVPSAVLQTAVVAGANDTALTARAWQYDTNYSLMMVMHFADFQKTQLRQFDIYVNQQSGLAPLESYSPRYLTPTYVYVEDYRATDGNYNITLVATNASVLPPMINAIEIYARVPYKTPTTLTQDCKPAQFLPSYSPSNLLLLYVLPVYHPPFLKL
jgi:hypothetical protein